MPVDFDEIDVNSAIEEVEQSSSIAPLSRPQELSSIDDDMLEVEKRLEMAQYYRLVLSDTIFSDPPNVEIADRVESEIREFVRSRMSFLVGVGSKKEAPPALPFSEAEIAALRTMAQPDVVAALKALAAKVLKKPEILDAKPRPVVVSEKTKEPRKEPSLRKREIVRRPGPVQQARPTGGPSEGQQAIKGQQQKRVFKKVQREDGTMGEVDVTPPALPVGVKPIPTPVGRAAIEATAAQTARQQAMVAVANLDKQFSSK